MEPTTWTPERAMAMLRCWRDATSWSSFSGKWGNPDRDKAAFEALESAAAEIERQKARADGLAADLAACVVRADRAEGDRDGYNEELLEHINARDALALSGDIGVGESLADAVKRLKAELAKAQQHPAMTEGPSDERIAKLLGELYDDDDVPMIVWEVVGLVARRAGVRL